jgi:type IV pilus assembly protein PilQ
VLLQDLSFTSSTDQTNVAVRASRPFDYTSYYPNPRLFILDITGAQSSLEKNFVDLKTNQVEFASVSQIGDGPRPMVRIEFNLARAIQYSLKPEGGKLFLTFRALNPVVSESAAKPEKAVASASAELVTKARPAVPGELELNEDSQKIELLLPTASKVSVKHFELQSPNRLVIDVSGSVYRVSKQAVKIDSDLIRKIRFGYGDTEQGKLVRCVFDLSRKTAYAVEPAEGGVLIRFQKGSAVVTVPKKPVLSDSVESLAPAPVAVPEASQPIAMASLSSANRSDFLLMAELRDLAVPQPVAAPRFSLPEGNMTAVRLEPKDAQADTGLVRNSLPQWIEPLPPVEMAVRRSAAIQTAQRTPPPVLFAVPEPPAEIVETPIPVAEQKPAVPAAPPAKAALLTESKPPESPAPLQVAALVPQNPQPVIAVRPAAAPAEPVPTAPAVALPIQAPTSQVITAVPVAQAPKYSGELISLELKDADLKDFFRLIGEISGLNIVLDPDVKGTLTIFLNDVPWDQALDVVLKNNSLGKQLDGNVLRIASNVTLEAEEAQRKRLSDARVLSAELQTETRVLSYAKAADLSLVLKKVLSPRGDIIVDVRTNSMIISDIPGKFETLDALIKQLDKKIKQVEIEARVIAATRDFLRDIGVQIGALYGNNSQNKLAGAVPGNPFSRNPPPSVTMDPGQSGGANDSLPFISNLGANAPTSALSFFGGFTNNFLVDVIITAAERRGSAKLISKPKIITQDNIEGFVQQGVKIPVQTTINNTVSVQFFDFSLKLTVTPQITDEGTIVLKVDVENSTPDFSRQVQGVPTVNTQQTKTTVLVNNGGTVVVGGVLIDNEQVNIRQVPGFGSIPLIGHLFKNRSVNKQTQELIFFLSPKIL